MPEELFHGTVKLNKIRKVIELNQNPIVFYDGFCNLCLSVVSLVKRLDKKKIFSFLPLQSSDAIEILDNFVSKNNRYDSVVLYNKNQIYLQSDAVIEISKLLGFPFNLTSILKIIPLSIRDIIYKFIAARRYQWFGKRNTCRMPDK